MNLFDFGQCTNQNKYLKARALFGLNLLAKVNKQLLIYINLKNKHMLFFLNVQRLKMIITKMMIIFYKKT